MTASPLTLTSRCACGGVEIAATGKPILTAVCYCQDCQAAAKVIEALPNAPKVTDGAGGTPLVLQRKDRMTVIKGGEVLKDFRLKPDSPTRRVVASCCNAMMFLDFQKGHWFSMHRDRFGAAAPAVEMRVNTKSAREGVALPEGGGVYKTFPFKFIGKLLMARFAMMIGR